MMDANTTLVPIENDVLALLLELGISPTQSFNDTLRRELPKLMVLAKNNSPAVPPVSRGAGFPVRDQSPAPIGVRRSNLRPASRGGVSYVLFGEKHHAANAMVATIEILVFFESCCDRFFERMAPRVRTRSRNHLAQNRAAVYPLCPHLMQTVREIAPGWYLGTNISNNIKRSILAKACEVAGISFGSDLKIAF